jgi:hypothetical protein
MECTASYQHNHRTAHRSGEANDWCNNSSRAVKKQVTAGEIYIKMRVKRRETEYHTLKQLVFSTSAHC